MKRLCLLDENPLELKVLSMQFCRSMLLSLESFSSERAPIAQNRTAFGLPEALKCLEGVGESSLVAAGGQRKLPFVCFNSLFEESSAFTTQELESWVLQINSAFSHSLAPLVLLLYYLLYYVYTKYCECVGTILPTIGTAFFCPKNFCWNSHYHHYNLLAPSWSDVESFGN